MKRNLFFSACIMRKLWCFQLQNCFSSAFVEEWITSLKRILHSFFFSSDYCWSFCSGNKFICAWNGNSTGLKSAKSQLHLTWKIPFTHQTWDWISTAMLHEASNFQTLESVPFPSELFILVGKSEKSILTFGDWVDRLASFFWLDCMLLGKKFLNRFSRGILILYVCISQKHGIWFLHLLPSS